ncbi:MAG: GNAT family N-acetyltransferase [Verrucomicrobiota bacterium]
MIYSQPALLTVEHDVSAFDCGNAALNAYLTKYALQNNAAGAARTYVTVVSETSAAVGYYSLAAASVERNFAPERVAKGLARHPVPVVLLARLAVDRSHQGRGLGNGLLKDALLRSLSAAQTIGIRAILVHAKDERAADFYRQFGFTASPTDSLHLFMLMKDIAKTLE